jgi:alpha-glucosidase (family GH31 glycosyl hydrolase)
MQYHSDVNAHRLPSRDRTPWNIQEQTGDMSVIPIFRKFVNFRMNLLPYIFNQARESSLTGLPLMRALPLEYPSDTVCRKYPYEYLFGEALLVAPIMEEGISTWPVYLPKGEWRELWTGEFHRGPAVLEVNAPRDRIPAFQKKGSLLALNLGQSGELGSPVGNATEDFNHLTLQVIPDGKIEYAFIYSAKAAPVSLSVETAEEEHVLMVMLPALPIGVELVLFGPEPSSVMLNEIPLPRLEASVPSVLGGDLHWNWREQEIRIHLPGPSQAATIILR